MSAPGSPNNMLKLSSSYSDLTKDRFQILPNSSQNRNANKTKTTNLEFDFKNEVILNPNKTLSQLQHEIEHYKVLLELDEEHVDICAFNDLQKNLEIGGPRLYRKIDMQKLANNIRNIIRDEIKIGFRKD